MGPLIGASGAIAGVMGAFLIRYWNTRIEFFYLFFLFIRGTFKAPAWLMLPLWAILELFNARMVDSISPETGGGVAHWAHVWGFVLGAGIALVIKFNRVEERHIAPKIQKQISYVSDSYQALEEATVLKRQGDFNQAFSLLLAAVEKDPSNDDVVEGLWNLGAELDRIEETSEYMIKLIEREIRRNQLEQALHHYRRLKERVPKVPLSLPYKIKILEILSKEKSPIEANSLAGEMLGQMNTNSPAMLVLNFARISFSLDPRLAKKAAELCAKHPEITDSQKEEVKEKYDGLKAKVRFDFDEVSGQYAPFQTKIMTPEKSEPEKDIDETRMSEEETTFDALQAEEDSGTASPEDASTDTHQPEKAKKADRFSAYLNFDDDARFDEIQPDTSIYGETEEKPVQVEEESSQSPEKSGEPFEAGYQEKMADTAPEIESAGQAASSSDEEPTPQFPGVEDAYASFPGIEEKDEGSQIKSGAEDQEPDSSWKQPEAFPADESKLSEEPKEKKEPSDKVRPEEKISMPVEPAPSKAEIHPVEIEPEPKSAPAPPKKVKFKEEDTYFTPVRNKTLKLIKANLKGIKGDKLSIDALKIGPRLLPLDKVKTIAVAEITSPYEPSYYLIDLFLDDIKSDLTNIRSVRLFSSAFDPVKFFPDVPDSKKALKAFIAFLLKTSKATPVPDESSVLLEKPHKYFFIEDYEDFILS
jgi:tetratricopeptide (TPR) repeat protein